jgi:hypothetical protein
MLALIFLPVDWMIKIDFMLGLAVDVLGVGIVVKNTAHPITIPRQVSNTKMLKTTTMLCVAVKNLDFVKKTTVRVVTVDTVENGGKHISSLVECQLLLKQLQKLLLQSNFSQEELDW